ncbi:hypothetical protein [Kordia zhangzhouensis]|uniref:hypothetical protein n=1 Tax=Kordia zhangzhouensis TaxID=1620405 RepID=UPI000629A85D|nr:hypothetical protein [Kordia zhangzhouensis]
MKNLKNFSQKLKLNKSKIVDFYQSNHIKGGIVPETSVCALANGTPLNTYTLLCGKDTIDTQ